MLKVLSFFLFSVGYYFETLRKQYEFHYNILYQIKIWFLYIQKANLPRRTFPFFSLNKYEIITDRRLPEASKVIITI